MSKSTKMNDFRTLDLSDDETPTEKNVGAVSAKKKSNNKSKGKYVSKEDDLFEENIEKKSHLGLTVFFVVLVFMGAVLGLMFTPVFNIINVNTIVDEYVSQEEVLTKVDGLIGQNIWRINIKSLKKSLKEMPYVKDAEIVRSLPDTITITIEERKPYALIKYLESFLVVDKYGYILEIKKENDLPDLAIIYGIELNDFVVGEKIEDVAGLKYENITYLLENSYRNDFDYSICEINYSDTEKLMMAVKELDIDINFGEIDRTILTEKMGYLNGALKKLSGKKGYLDISSSNYLEKTIFRERY